MHSGEDSASSGVATRASVVEAAIAAYRALADRGEEVADEWQYVNDLVAVHTADMRGLIGEGGMPVGPAIVAAVDAAIDEIGLITDPHRAIDWLSSFPQIVRVALDVPQAPAVGS